MDSRDRGIFVLRAVVGLGFLFAGLDKFFMWAGGTPFTSAGFLKFATGGAWLGSCAWFGSSGWLGRNGIRSDVFRTNFLA